MIAHRVVGIDREREAEAVFALRGDAAGSADELVESRQILGRVSTVERKSWSARLRHATRLRAGRLMGHADPNGRAIMNAMLKRFGLGIILPGLLVVGLAGVSTHGESAAAGLAAPRIGGQSGAHATSAPTLTSNKADYQPGDTVTLTGTGWAPRELVTLVMTVEPATHGPVTLTSMTDRNGKFTNSGYVVQQSDLGVRFHVTATGGRSRLTALTTFTDRIGTPVGIGTNGYASTSIYTSLPVSVTSAVAVNNTVIIAIVAYTSSSTTLTVSDSAGNTYTKDADVTNSAPTRTLVFSARVNTALSIGSTITVYFPSGLGTGIRTSMRAHSLSAALSRPRLLTRRRRQRAVRSDSASVGPTATTSQASELLIGAFGLDIASPFGSPTFSAGSGYTALPAHVISNGWGIYPEYRIVSATGTYSATGSWNGGVYDWAAAIVTYKAPAPPPSASHSTISPAATSLIANGTSTQVITVQARNAANNNLNYGGSTVLMSLSGTGTLGAVTDNGNGTYTATLTSPTTQGSATITATLGGVAVGTAVSASSSVVTFVPPVPVSATGTYTVSTVGNDTIYTFTGSGTFTPAYAVTAQILVVSGGGGGGGAVSVSSSADAGGGGGAGGFVYADRRLADRSVVFRHGWYRRHGGE